MRHFLISPANEVNCILWDSASPYPVAAGWLLLNEADFATWRADNPEPTVDEAKLAEEIRAERNKKLVESDWSQVVDTPQAIKDKWAPYRQQLRDLTTQPQFPHVVVWPNTP
jgi:hypothetical protein